MQKLSEVESAKAVMTEAMSWSVVKWLREKKRVRLVADRANAVLDRVRKDVQKRWTEDLRAAYASARQGNAGGNGQKLSYTAAAAQSAVNTILEADDEASRARHDAEQTFDNADRQMSTRMAREGCQKAIRSWELHERAIEKAEALVVNRSAKK